MVPILDRRAFDSAFRLDDAQLGAIDVLTAAHEGVYLWGPVGRGKTWLLDRYYAGVETNRKTRVHFHSFFRDLHAAYFRHGFSLEGAIDELLGGIELLCFDEFHVHDVADGRLVSRMLDALFDRRITMVATSNYPPTGLMPNPLFHQTFVPTIELLSSKLRVVRVDGPVDYRGRGDAASKFSTGNWSTTRTKEGHTFDELCDAPKSTGDYLAMIDRQEISAVTDIPRFADVKPDAVQRFFNLVDVLYDRDVAVDFHAAGPPEIVSAGFAGLDVERVLSRLAELRYTEKVKK